MATTNHTLRPQPDRDAELLEWLRQHRRQHRVAHAPTLPSEQRPMSLGQRVADRVAATVGSWRFIIGQSLLIVLWMGYNVARGEGGWDPYPFILLNLALSFQAADTAPCILMSQNREQEIDRQAAAEDYRINIKAELEIELLHQKIDALREQEVLALTRAVQELAELLRAERRATG